MHNIHRSIPQSRLTNRTDSCSYNRAKIHLSVFRKILLEDVEMLVESQQWVTVLDYVISAWEIVSMTPIWDNPVHNVSRISCFKHLASTVLKASKCHKIIKEQKEKLLELMKNSSIQDVEICRNFLAVTF